VPVTRLDQKTPKSIAGIVHSRNRRLRRNRLARDIRLESTCEHHIAPSLPCMSVFCRTGGSFCHQQARTRGEAYADTTANHEKLTAPIANTIQECAATARSSFLLESRIQCMTHALRPNPAHHGHQPLLGAFLDDASLRSDCWR